VKISAAINMDIFRKQILHQVTQETQFFSHGARKLQARLKRCLSVLIFLSIRPPSSPFNADRISEAILVSQRLLPI
jgi:hypothetical protein